jgi:hypothetical protein
MERTKISWLDVPEEHDFPAAASYLNLIYGDKAVADMVQRLRDAPLSHFKSKDIFRASSLSLLGVSNARVKRDIQKIKSGEPLSPLLLVRDSNNGKVIIADGYHRLCALYTFDEGAVIPCKIVSIAVHG